MSAMLARIITQRLEQLRALAEQLQQLVAVKLASACLRASVGRQQDPLRGRRVGTQLGTFATIFPVAVLARLRQVAQIQLGMRMLAR
ncbi:hypothetical protein WL11_26025 [Burkholderia ubonensis]|uniref:Uncharacterized protein n=1 Tax=Burkholderia ubonensis TaxID=101571 RepID=A0ABD6Q1K3_9BURK|nr:hypothetical protein WK51_31240 [Burkholderia ubonensis]KVX96631.1 hypothetical protein WL11_26025 [Burkholderia ubonensis]OJA45472.1 hypothetical protein BGV66_18845 [Burkholderia ubonensis]